MAEVLVIASGNSVRDCLAAARRVLNIPLKGNRQKIVSGGEDGCYRVTLESDIVVECTMIPHSKAAAMIHHNFCT